MRWRTLFTAMLLLGTCGILRAVEFPYAAYVNSADVYVRSGPGRDYYPTAKLRKGQRVEIYRHDPGGWLAIKPPRQSFAWVNKRHLDPDGEGLATVNSDRVVARVGSDLSDVRDVIQVRLDKGEQVELLAPPAEDSPWCKIAPPSGEFRWIFSKYVDRDLPGDIAQDDREAEAARGYVTSRGDDDDGQVRLTSAESDPAAAGPAGRGRAATLAELENNSTFGRELNHIDLELSAMVAQEVSAWSFDDLKQRVEGQLQKAQTPLERGHAHLLMTKLERFGDIKTRHEALRRGTDATARATTPINGDEFRRADAARFDGVGRLSPVISDKVGGPTFALVDNSNAVISFVTAAPGVNLRPYVDHYVGVNGQRGYLTDLQRQHINVQRVTVLESERR